MKAIIKVDGRTTENIDMIVSNDGFGNPNFIEISFVKRLEDCGKHEPQEEHFSDVYTVSVEDIYKIIKIFK